MIIWIQLPKINSYFSPDKKSNGIKLFSKIFSNITKSHRKLSKEKSNKIFSVTSSPFMNSSYNNTDTTENKNKMKKYEVKNENKGNLFTKIFKSKNNIYLHYIIYKQSNYILL